MKRLFMKMLVIGGLMAGGAAHAKSLTDALNAIVKDAQGMQAMWQGSAGVSSIKDKIQARKKIAFNKDPNTGEIFKYTKQQRAEAVVATLVDLIAGINLAVDFVDNVAVVLGNIPAAKDQADKFNAKIEQVKDIMAKVGSGISTVKSLGNLK